MLDIEIRGGAEDLAILAKRLKETGDKGLRKELLSGLQRAAKPAKAAVRASVLSELPHRGGLADLIGGSLKVTLNTRSAGRNPGVRIWSKDSHDISKLNKGELRHPVFGNRKNWVAQVIKAGIFTDPIEQRAPQMRQEMGQVMRTVAAKIEAGH